MVFATVLIWGRKDAGGALRAYEARALGIFRRHGGELVAAYRPEGAGERPGVPDEIHLLRIATRAAFAAFLADPERAALAAERDAAVARTEVFLSASPVDYPA